jgi:cytidylate kinase
VSDTGATREQRQMGHYSKVYGSDIYDVIVTAYYIPISPPKLIPTDVNTIVSQKFGKPSQNTVFLLVING